MEIETAFIQIDLQTFSIRGHPPPHLLLHLLHLHTPHMPLALWPKITMVFLVETEIAINPTATTGAAASFPIDPGSKRCQS